MTTLTIRNVDPELKEELRVRAARHGRSMEAELRHILKKRWAARSAAPSGTWPRPFAGVSCRWAAPTSLSPTRPCRFGVRAGSTGDRPRHQRPL
jgi:hypothetical protein